MKSIFILVILTFSACLTYGQTIDMFKRKPMEEAKLKWLLRDSLAKINTLLELQKGSPNSLGKIPNATEITPLQTKKGVYKIPLSGVYIGDNGKGDEVYAMQPDNMPCLVPGKSLTYNMPVMGLEKSESNDLPLLKKGSGGDKE